MGYYFSDKSEKILLTCDKKLQKLAKTAILYTRVDFAIISGERNKTVQDSLFRANKSKLVYPYSKHNQVPSAAFDFAVWSETNHAFIWKPLSYYFYLYGVFDTIAKEQGIVIRSGLNWDSDADFEDNTFLDGGHIELIG